MKALEKDRNRRYETASAFAADIQRYLADEPVQACPPSAVYRVKKSLRRHKGPVLAAALVVVALLAGLTATSWQAVRARDAEKKALADRDAKGRALQAEQRARQEASRATAQTLEALRAITDAPLWRRQFGGQVQLTEADRAFFTEVLTHYERLAAFKGDSPEGRALRAEGHLRACLIHTRMGEWRDALRAYEQAHALYEQLAADFPGVPAYRSGLAASRHTVGDALSGLGRTSDAEAELRRALAQYQQLEAEFPGSPEYRDGIADCRGYLAALLSGQGKRALAEEEYRQALLAGDRVRWRLALGNLLAEQNRLAEAEAEFRQALAVQNKLAADSHNADDERSRLAKCHRELGRVVGSQGKRPEADAEYRAALAIDIKVAAEFPAVPKYRQDLAKTHEELGKLLRELGRAADAEAEFRQAAALQERLVEDFRENSVYRVQLALSYTGLGLALQDQKLLEQAIVAHRRAVQLHPAFPGAYANLLDALSKAGRLDEAVREYEGQVRGEPGDALGHYLLALALCRKGRWQDAADHFTRVLALDASYPRVHATRAGAYGALGRGEDALADYATEAELRPNAADAHNALAWYLATCPDARYRDGARAVAAGRRAVDLAPQSGGFWNTLGAAHYRAGDWESAVQAFEKSMQLQGGGNAFDWFFLAMAHGQRGNKDEARRWYDRAVQWMDKNQPENKELGRFRAEAAELLGVTDD
jgi:tetratricopeptide (TPR) repeat protein